ncbi:MAG: aldehyde-activating protein [Devosia sp.]|nr:aldehyde-activating protein [Devosia sp.]
MPTLASCHCGGTVIALPGPPTHATQCTCTYCTKTGGLWSYYPPDAVRIVKAEHLGLYAPNTHNEHYFCTRCGITTHGVSPDWELGGEGIPGKQEIRRERPAARRLRAVHRARHHPDRRPHPVVRADSAPAGNLQK